MTYTRDSFQQLSETYSSIVEKKVKYYKGEDRDKETGIPKGVKTQTSTKQPKERKQTKPPYESLAASHELQGDVVEAKKEDAKMGRASDQELSDAHKKFSGMDQSMPSNQFMLKRLNKEINKRKKQKPVSEAKVDAGKSPETKEKERNVRKFGVSHNVSGHGKLRRSLHKMNRGDKKIKGDKSAWVEMESAIPVVVEKDLNAAERRALPNKDFVFPGKGEGPEGKQRGAYPINDKKHARNALAMAAAHASPEKQAKVKAAVKKKFPDIEVKEQEEVVSELNRYGKETGKATGSMNKKSGTPVKKGGSTDKALNIVRGMIRKQQGRPEGQQKKTKGVKSDAGTGKYLSKQQDKKDYAAKAKKAGFKDTQSYTDTVARYGGESNYKAGRGLGT